MWPDTIGTLLDVSDTGAWTLGSILRCSLPRLLQRLPQVGNARGAGAGPATAAAADLDPRAHDKSTGLGLLYRALSLLHQPSDKLQQQLPPELLHTEGAGSVEKACRHLQWALLYAPQDAALWRRLAAFYHQTAETLMRGSAVAWTPAVRGPPTAETRGLCSLLPVLLAISRVLALSGGFTSSLAQADATPAYADDFD